MRQAFVQVANAANGDFDRMGRVLPALLATTAILTIGPKARAADDPGQPSRPLAGGTEAASQLEEIVVTARRRYETLEDVPQTVNAVSSQQIQKLNILKLEDITTVVPGLNLESGNTGYNAVASVRGVSYDATSGAGYTVAFYVNDAPIDANSLFQSLFDIGQIEVLRGPQGTLHGSAAPSGAITVRTQQPDMYQFGGYVTGTGGYATQDHSGNYNGQGAINLPLIAGKLAMRLAGVVSSDDYNGVHSINSAISPSARTEGGRVSLRFEPNDDLSAQLLFQHLERRLVSFDQVYGPGAGYNGPAIAASQRLAVANIPNHLEQRFNFANANIDYSFAGQKLSYIGHWGTLDIHAVDEKDDGNQLPAAQLVQDNHTTQWMQSHELRLSSDQASRLWDYTAGAVFGYQHTDPLSITGPAAYLPGTFGSPLSAPSPLVFNSAYELSNHITSPPGITQSVSIYGNLSLHLPGNNEVTAGARYSPINKLEEGVSVDLLPGQIAVPLPIPCRLAGLTSTYPGTCNAPIRGSQVLNQSANPSDHPVLYSVSFAHKFNDSLMAYVNSGSGYRQGPFVVGINNAAQDPVLTSLTFLKPEKSYSFEGGIKTTFLDNRGRFNFAYFHQIYNGLIYNTLPVTYLSDNGAQSVPSTTGFTTNANARVDGIDADAGFAITKQWSIDATFSYAKGYLASALIPCNPPGGNTSASAFPPGTHVFLCRSSASTSKAPLWSETTQSEYRQPIGSGLDAFLRGLVSVYPRNKNASATYVAPAYAIVNLYAGLRSESGAWELTAFVKNLANASPTLALDYQQALAAGLSPATFGSSGYQISSATAMVPAQRTVGLTATYAFGSR